MLEWRDGGWIVQVAELSQTYQSCTLNTEQDPDTLCKIYRVFFFLTVYFMKEFKSTFHPNSKGQFYILLEVFCSESRLISDFEHCCILFESIKTTKYVDNYLYILAQ